jgi:hypothetical protein
MKKRGITGGGGDEPKTNVYVQSDVVKKVTDRDIMELKSKIERMNTTLGRQNDWIFKEENGGFWSQFTMLNLIEAATATITNTFDPSILLNIDFVGALLLTLMECIASIIQVSSFTSFVTVTQYVYWMWLLGSGWYLMGTSGWWALSLIVPTIGIFNTAGILPRVNAASVTGAEINEATEKLEQMQKDRANQDK